MPDSLVPCGPPYCVSLQQIALQMPDSLIPMQISNRVSLFLPSSFTFRRPLPGRPPFLPATMIVADSRLTGVLQGVMFCLHQGCSRCKRLYRLFIIPEPVKIKNSFCNIIPAQCVIGYSSGQPEASRCFSRLFREKPECNARTHLFTSVLCTAERIDNAKLCYHRAHRYSNAKLCFRPQQSVNCDCDRA